MMQETITVKGMFCQHCVKVGFVYQGKAADRSLSAQEHEQNQGERTLTI